MRSLLAVISSAIAIGWAGVTPASAQRDPTGSQINALQGLNSIAIETGIWGDSVGAARISSAAIDSLILIELEKLRIRAQRWTPSLPNTRDDVVNRGLLDINITVTGRGPYAVTVQGLLNQGGVIMRNQRPGSFITWTQSMTLFVPVGTDLNAHVQTTVRDILDIFSRHYLVANP
jgi:hypothetical protein